jgi:hypothetical protein
MPAQRMQQPRIPMVSKLTVLFAAAAGVAASLALHTLPAQAQRQVPKIGSICPMGYVDMLNGKCSTLGLMTYTVQPTNGQPCLEGWMNVGGGYCRKK